MDRSLFLAQLLGPVLVVLGTGLLANREAFRAVMNDFLASAALIFLSGLLALVPGLAIVLTHNVWVSDWPVLITVFGWLATLGGVLRILFPALVRRVAGAVMPRPGAFLAGGAAMILLGLTLCYFGYVAG